MPSTPPESILVADCGAVATKVGLIDTVAGEAHVLAVARTPTTAAAPHSDITLGVRQAVLQLETLTGRQLLDDNLGLITPARSLAEGVDAFVAVTSAALPLRTALIGLSRDFSVAGARRVLNSSYAVVDHTIAVDEETGRWGTTARDGRAGGPSAAVEKLAAARPDVIVMVGGTDGGAVAPLREMANIVAAVGAAIERDLRPHVIFAGNREARTDVAERIGGLMEITSVENVMPALDALNLAPLQNEIKNIFNTRSLSQIPGLDKLAAWSQTPIFQAADAFALVARYLARRYALRVLAIDMGGAATTLIHAHEDEVIYTTAADLGVGYGLQELLTRVGIERIARWLPPSVESEAAHAQLLNQSLRPWTVPARSQDLVALDAAGREVLAGSLGAWNAQRTAFDADLVLFSGAPLARGSSPGSIALMALDALELQGVFSMAGDPLGIAPALGAAAAINPEAAAQALENDVLVTWGTTIVPNVSPYMTEATALQVRLETAHGSKLDAEVHAGSLELIPLEEGNKAKIEIRTKRGVNLGQGSRGAFKREVQGGIIGLLIDARGRPLRFHDNLDRRRERVQQWMWEVGA